MRRKSSVLKIIYCLSFVPSVASASNITVNFGPPAVGRGGSNPVGIPPGLADIGFVHLGGSSGNREISVSIAPGLFLWGYRTEKKQGAYLAAGAGIVSSAVGVGFGPYTAAGIDLFCGSLCFNFEYRQAVGLTLGGQFMSPYALRMGVSWWY